MPRRHRDVIKSNYRDLLRNFNLKLIAEGFHNGNRHQIISNEDGIRIIGSGE